MNIRATPSLSAFRSATMIPYELSGLLVIWSRFQEHSIGQADGNNRWREYALPRVGPQAVHF